MAGEPGIRFNKMEEAIIDAAADLFDRQGYNQTSLQDIADALGLARPSLYHYFKNKEEILLAGISQITSRRNAFVETARSEVSTPVARLTTLVDHFAAFISESPVWIRVLVREEPAVPDGSLLEELESRLALFTLLVETIKAGVEEGSMRNLDEHVVAYMIISTITGIAGRYAAPLPDRSVLATATAQVIVQGVLEQTPRTRNPAERGVELVREGLRLIERSQRQTAVPLT
jgi:AcrR family transcriptional regulator